MNLLIFLIPLSIFAQSKIDSGIILYDVDSNKIAKEMRGQMDTETIAFLENIDETIKQMQLQIIFDKKLSESEIIYKKSAEGKSMLNATAKRLIGRGKFYIDLEDSDVFQKTKHRWETILVYSNLSKINWKLIDSTTVIKGYRCSYAVANFSTHTNKFNEGKREIHAWYTKEIPIKIGPLDYGNLPGLIVELDALVFIYTLESVDFEYEPLEPIKIPNNLKKISEEKYNTEITKDLGRDY